MNGVTLAAWIWIGGFTVTGALFLKHDIAFIAREVLRYEMPDDDLPEWALPLVLLIVAFFMWPYLLGSFKGRK